MIHNKISALMLSMLSASALAGTIATKSGTPADPGVINKESILYWMEKRGELKPNASDVEKRQALKNYLGKKSFTAKPLPGGFGRKMMAEQKTPFASYRHETHASTQKSSKTKVRAQGIENPVTNVNVLALLIEFPDHTADKATYTLDHYTNILFNKSDIGDPSADIASASHYFHVESGGTFNFDGQVNNWTDATWLMADNNAEYYGGNDDNDDDKAVPELVKEAVTKAVAAGLNLDDYDLNHDGVIDHVMVFHSSIGEEAGGGTLGADAIWSHRFVSTEADGSPAIIEGSDIKLYGYTVTPVNGRVGVIAHEFGHDLGYPDEYDTAGGAFGSPVGDWSIMASGSWVDGGSHPSGFSPLAKDFLQENFGGNWINQQELDFSRLDSEDIALVAASNHGDGEINQLKVVLPTQDTMFSPYNGSQQFYSSEGHDLNSTLSFNLDLPTGTSSLTMKAHWDIELDWDYVLVKVNGTVIAGNHTKANNSEHDNVSNFISGNSKGIEGAEGELGWVDLTFDLSTYEGQSIEVTIEYITDTYVSGYGFVADDIKVINEGVEILNDGAEEQATISLAGGFSSTPSWTVAGAKRNYYVQLRDFKGTDEYLGNSGFDAGVVVWYNDRSLTNNQVNNHPGEVFIGVVDGDQNPIKRGSNISGTGTQIRDAAFSLFDQSTYTGDLHLTAVSKFDDKQDYSAPYQPESGIKLPVLGLSMEVITQGRDSDTATVQLKNNGTDVISTVRNGRDIEVELVSESLVADTEVVWQMGDGTSLTGVKVSHTYTGDEQFDIAVAYENQGGVAELNKSVTIGEAVTGTITPLTVGKEVTFVAELSGGRGDLVYRWDFGNGSDVSTEQQPTVTYDDLGEYVVTLSVIDESNVTYEIVLDFVLDVQPVSATISQTITNLKVNFSSSITGGSGDNTYLWNFGDGNTSTSQNPIHFYTAAGTYDVTLLVTDSAGESSEATTSVTVTAATVVTPPPATNSGGGSGGGSLGLFALFGLLLTTQLRAKK